MNRNRYIITALLFVQALLIVVAFNGFFANPSDFMLWHLFDGFKNYYTFAGYLSEANSSLLRFELMNYPYGDYIFYTDNTPLLAFPLKLFCHYIWDVSDYSIPIFNVFCMLSLLLSAYLAYRILYKLLGIQWMAFIFGIALAWINPQILRILAGHANLSFSWVILLALFWLLELTTHFDDPKKRRRIGGWLVFCLILGGFSHLYYLGILGMMITGFCFGMGLIRFIDWWRFSHWLSYGLLVCLVGGGIVYGIIRSVDSYYEGRPSVALGHDAAEYTIKPMALVLSYKFMRMGPIRLDNEPVIQAESSAYLGIFNLLVLAGLGLLWLFKRKAFIPLTQIFVRSDRISAWVLACLLAGAFCLFTSMGETNYLAGGKYKIHNILSPFFYVGMFTEAMHQFRCLGRFMWPFFWGISFFVLYIVAYYWRYSQHGWIRVALAIFMLAGLVDAKDSVQWHNYNRPPNLLTNADRFPDVKQLATLINPNDYQAMLPLPLYRLGSENPDYMVWGDPHVFTTASQFSLLTGLPSLGNHMSRTSNDHAKEIFTIFSEAGVSETLKSHFDNRPILIFYSKSFNANLDWYDGPEGPGKELIINGPKIIERYGMTKVAEHSDYILYRWDL